MKQSYGLVDAVSTVTQQDRLNKSDHSTGSALLHGISLAYICSGEEDKMATIY